MAYVTYASAGGASLDADIVGGEVVAVRLVSPTPYVVVGKLVSPTKTLRVERVAAGGTFEQSIPKRDRAKVTVTDDDISLPDGWGVEIHVCQIGKGAESVS